MGVKLLVNEGGRKGHRNSDVDVGYARVNVYFGSNVGLLKRLAALAVRHKGVSVSGLVVTCCAACIDTLEKDLPTFRRFKLNGKDVEL